MLDKLNIIDNDTVIADGVHVLCDKSDNSMISTSLFKKKITRLKPMISCMRAY